VDKEKTFKYLLEKWKSETKYMSSLGDMSKRESFQKIVEMGHDAIPFILKELEQEGSHIFYALHLITGENPIPKEDAGKIKQICDTWVLWGKAKGYTP
jgi:hypothetical protein